MADIMHDNQLKYRLEMCVCVLNKYSWLLDSYVLDFFTENHLEKLPKSWFNQVKNIPLEEFYYLINFSVKTKYVWPLSLICLRVLIQFLQIPRKVDLKNDFSLIESNKINKTKLYEIIKVKSTCFEHSKVLNYFLKHVKPKKRYEIFKMATTTSEIANKLNVKYVVDVGSGLGHLSRIMAYGFDLGVCSIETQTQLTTHAIKMDREFEKIAKKYIGDLKFDKRPVHLNQMIRFDISADDFEKNIKKAFSLSENLTFGIVGLHPCGDLAAVLLKLYANCSAAKFINLVGCCYHKLSTSSSTTQDVGFPLTQFSINKQVDISYEARALACHAIESYCHRLNTKNYSHLKVHCYRAALEFLIKKNYPEHRKCVLGNVKSTELTFSQYCEIALKKINLKMPEDDLESEETRRNLSEWENVVKFYTLRLMLAPLIETVILLDREIFLIEKGFRCMIKAAFDPEISPRNQILISEKT